MNELRDDQELTTADIANSQRGREYRSAVIDERPIASQSAAPVTQDTDERAISSQGPARGAEKRGNEGWPFIR